MNRLMRDDSRVTAAKSHADGFPSSGYVERHLAARAAVLWLVWLGDSDRLLVSGRLTPGERVVTEGTQRLREGATLIFEDENG